MIGTIIAFILAVFTLIQPYVIELDKPKAYLMLVLAIPFFFFVPTGLIFSWNSLVKAEQNSTPRIVEMFRRDFHIRAITAWLILFPLLSIFFSLDILYTQSLNKAWLFAIWLVFLGISIDAVIHFCRRIVDYLNPFSMVKMFTNEARESIRNDKVIELCHWIDGLSEVALKGAQRNSISLTNFSLTELEQVARLFLESLKSISHRAEDKETKALGISDKASYVMFYLYQRLDMIFDKALKSHLEPICSVIITLFGKLAVDAAKYDISLASPPLRFLGKCAKAAQDEGLEETVLKASCLYPELARTILKDIDITYLEIKDPFLSIINGMEVLAKGMFKRDKQLSIPFLMQPFIELREMFKGEKEKVHQDTPVIVQNIDRVLGEFEALQMVMNTVPPLSELVGEERPSMPEGPATGLNIPNPDAAK